MPSRRIVPGGPEADWNSRGKKRAEAAEKAYRPPETAKSERDQAAKTVADRALH
jgi:hypothetical protein